MDLSKQPLGTYALENRAPADKPDYGFAEVIDGVVRVHTPTGEDVVHRGWHANGVLRYEMRVVNYKTEGVFREWHDNGVLAEEAPYEEGLRHGIVRQFNKEGKLLGEYEMSHGRGLQIAWYDDGSLRSTYQQISSDACWGATYDDLGKPRKVFLWIGKPISRKRWYERLDEVQRTEAVEAEARVVADSRAASIGKPKEERTLFRRLRKMNGRKTRQPSAPRPAPPRVPPPLL
jgi:hypothetical protein